ncbi:hypothetical protein JCM21900_004694 [Sporobolomyces salmonicolor]
MVLGPDGKPCKVCTGFRAWTGATKKKPASSSSSSDTSSTSSASASALAAASLASSAPSSTSNEEPSLPSDCPPDVERLGRHTWTFLHTTASYFPPSPSPHQKSSMLSLLRSLPTLYPCGVCADHLGQYMERDPPERAIESGRDGIEGWMCRAHNEVNERLGKDKFDCASVGERWRDGWKDGRCD